MQRLLWFLQLSLLSLVLQHPAVWGQDADGVTAASRADTFIQNMQVTVDSNQSAASRMQAMQELLKLVATSRSPALRAHLRQATVADRTSYNQAVGQLVAQVKRYAQQALQHKQSRNFELPPAYIESTLRLLRWLWRVRFVSDVGQSQIVVQRDALLLLQHSPLAGVRLQAAHMIYDCARDTSDNTSMQAAREQMVTFILDRAAFSYVAYDIPHGTLKALMQSWIRRASQWVMGKTPLFSTDRAFNYQQTQRLNKELMHHWAKWVGWDWEKQSEAVTVNASPMARVILHDVAEVELESETPAVLTDAGSDNSFDDASTSVSEIAEAVQLLLWMADEKRPPFLRYHDPRLVIKQRAQAVLELMTHGDTLAKRLQAVRQRIGAHDALLRLLRDGRMGMLRLPAALAGRFQQLDASLQPQFNNDQLHPGYYGDVVLHSLHSDAGRMMLAIRQEAAIEDDNNHGSANRRFMLARVLDGSALRWVKAAAQDRQIPRLIYIQAISWIMDVYQRECLRAVGVGPILPQAGQRQMPNALQARTATLSDHVAPQRHELVTLDKVESLVKNIGEQLHALRGMLDKTTAATLLLQRLRGMLDSAQQVAAKRPRHQNGRVATQARHAVADETDFAALAFAVRQLQAENNPTSVEVVVEQAVPAATADENLAPAMPEEEVVETVPPAVVWDPLNYTGSVIDLNLPQLLTMSLQHHDLARRDQARQQLVMLSRQRRPCLEHQETILALSPDFVAQLGDANLSEATRMQVLEILRNWSAIRTWQDPLSQPLILALRADLTQPGVLLQLLQSRRSATPLTELEHAALLSLLDAALKLVPNITTEASMAVQMALKKLSWDAKLPFEQLYQDPRLRWGQRYLCWQLLPIIISKSHAQQLKLQAVLHQALQALANADVERPQIQQFV